MIKKVILKHYLNSRAFPCLTIVELMWFMTSDLLRFLRDGGVNETFRLMEMSQCVVRAQAHGLL